MKPLLTALFALICSVGLVAQPAAAQVQFSRPIYVPGLPQGPNNQWVVAPAATGDFNGDGNLDLVAVYADAYIRYSRYIEVHLGRGDGTFKGRQRIDITDFFNRALLDIKVTDLDQDGHLDMITVATGKVVVLFGRGDGLFDVEYYAAHAVLDGPYFAGLDVGDFTGDGRLDIVAGSNLYEAAEPEAPSLILFVNQGRRVFTEQRFIFFDERLDKLEYSTLKAVDFDRDGQLDLVAGALWRDQVYFLRGNGNGNFHSPTLIQAGINARRFQVGDLNNDQKPDFFGYDDHNGVPQMMRAFLGRGNGTVGAPISTTFDRFPPNADVVDFWDLKLADLNADRVLDAIVVANAWTSDISNTSLTRTTTAHHLSGRGDGSFGPPQQFNNLGFGPAYTLSGDFNNDQKTDVIISGWNIEWRAGGDEYPNHHTFMAVLLNGVSNTSLQTGDFLWQHSDGRLAVWQMNQAQFLGAIRLFAPNETAQWRAMGLGDFDRDSQSDVLFQKRDGRLAIGYLDGITVTRTETLGHLPAMPAQWQAVGVGDFNADGHKDVVWRDGQFFMVMLMDGKQFKAQRFIASALPWRAQLGGFADVDGDGHTDMVWQDNGVVWVTLMTGTTVKRQVPLNDGRRVGSGWTLVGVGNVDKPGWTRLLWRHDTGRTAVWYLQGTRRVGAKLLRDGKPVAPAWRLVGEK